jgi:ribosomal protein S6
MRHYELVFVLKPTLSEEEIKTKVPGHQRFNPAKPR